MINSVILDKVQKNFPRIAERKLQEEIAEVGKLQTFEAGDIIMDFGSYVKLVPLIIRGTIKVLREDNDGNEMLLYYLNPGQTCVSSFTCCMMNKKSEFKTVAEEDTELIAIPNRYMDDWMTRYQSWKNFVMLTYEDRFNELLHTLDSVAFKKMDARLHTYLSEKAGATGSKTLVTTHQQIAYDLNASREAVSRLLKQMEKDGLVKLGRNKIEVLG
jgi:CRP/FNR family transcriptional regulator